MNKIITIAKKELGTFFKSPIAYIILIGTSVIFNVFFFLIIEQNREASLRDIFKLMEFIFVFIIPLLTMRVFAEEKRSGTFEFLMTSPISPTSLVLGKYLGSFLFLSMIMGVLVVYYAIIEYFATPDQGAAVAGFIGIVLEGAFFLSVGILTSSWTKNQILAAIVSYTFLFTLYFSRSLIKYFSDLGQEVIRHFSVATHTEMFFSGLIYTADLVYFVSGTLFLLILTRINIGHRS